MYTNKLNSLDENGQILKTENLLSLNHKKIEHLNRPITIMEIESVTKISQNLKALHLRASLVISTKHLKTNTNSSQTFQKH